MKKDFSEKEIIINKIADYINENLQNDFRILNQEYNVEEYKKYLRELDNERFIKLIYYMFYEIFVITDKNDTPKI